jgi:hypothetical protein
MHNSVVNLLGRGCSSRFHLVSPDGALFERIRLERTLVPVVGSYCNLLNESNSMNKGKYCQLLWVEYSNARRCLCRDDTFL